ncbi:DUF3861 domain-containing protein [Budvicia aquatica]|uniref:DUF3861 domain-containing protein n=1 Tax=Budvicia aquatica TaxID=82979 RepID=A0A2C6DN68_9GAMM|nr:DUF3861 domain-containing protein [Budvicia aquatica]PHI30251.1 DUF3861 domain-containing protein [Budvicia aquatica]GKX53571.1 hypothetical protein SOASR029_38800 [Budvicia aquatica]
MSGYRYRITVEGLSDKKGEPLDLSPVSFEVENHDEILSLIEKMKARDDLGFDTNTATSFTVGLKLFSEVMMENRKHPLFEPLRHSFRDFMMLLKQGRAKPDSEE